MCSSQAFLETSNLAGKDYYTHLKFSGNHLLNKLSGVIHWLPVKAERALSLKIDLIILVTSSITLCFWNDIPRHKSCCTIR